MPPTQPFIDKVFRGGGWEFKIPNSKLLIRTESAHAL
jgi:hypothetical protein